jgi:hypothetical protein
MTYFNRTHLPTPYIRKVNHGWLKHVFVGRCWCRAMTRVIQSLPVYLCRCTGTIRKHHNVARVQYVAVDSIVLSMACCASCFGPCGVSPRLLA